MRWNNKGVDSTNLRISNNFMSGGKLERIAAYLCPQGNPSNFIISGGMCGDEKYQSIYPILDNMMGKYPIIVLHNNDRYMEKMLIQLWKNRENEKIPYWLVNQSINKFEPFYGMAEMQIITIFRQLARKLDYKITPKFEKVIRAHIFILKQLKIAVSLSGFYYLCSFLDMGEFHDNIMQLSCDEKTAQRIWTDMGVNEEDNQFDLFRTVVNNLAFDASYNGWNPDNSIDEINCIQAIKNNAVLSIAINDMHTNLLFSYFLEEFRANRYPFILILDGIKITDQQFVEYLINGNSGCFCGILTPNIAELFEDNENKFSQLMERINCFVIFKHSTGRAATIISEILGKYDYIKVEKSEGEGKKFFDFLPNSTHKDTRYTMENRYRVMPEEITSLKPKQAIIFDTLSDQIIHYN